MREVSELPAHLSSLPSAGLGVTFNLVVQRNVLLFGNIKNKRACRTLERLFVRGSVRPTGPPWEFTFLGKAFLDTDPEPCLINVQVEGVDTGWLYHQASPTLACSTEETQTLASRPLGASLPVMAELPECF